jgi:cell division protein FtsQ
MSAKIARGSGRRSRGRAKAPARGKAGARGSEAAAPLPEAVRKVSWWILLGMVAAVAVAGSLALGVPQALGAGLGEKIGQAGFSLRHVEIRGAERVPQIEVYNVAFDQPDSAMPLIDLEATRQRLLKFGWVREAKVSRRFPDTLVVELEERRPAAIWQHNRRLVLIDREGVVLEKVKLEAMPDLPLLIGPAANLHAAELGRLVDAAPHLRPMLAGATWVGQRRWDLRFQSGEVLALPEGEEAARKALARFASMDLQDQLLGRGFVRFDMRIPGKFVVRVSGEPGSTVPPIAPEAPPAPATTADVEAAKTI